MKIFRNIFGFIWGSGALITFCQFLLIIIIPSMLTYLVKDPRGQDYFIRLSCLWMNIWLFLVGCPVTIRGGNISKRGKPMWWSSITMRCWMFRFRRPMYPGRTRPSPRLPSRRSHLRLVLQQRFRTGRSENEKAAAVVSRRCSRFCIGHAHASTRKELVTGPASRLNLYDGAFKLALASQKQIIPCVIKGTSDAMPIHKKFPPLPHPPVDAVPAAGFINECFCRRIERESL